MNAWAELDAVLANRAAASAPVRLWWRDDDATTDGPRLQRLLKLATAHRVPLALAVIPCAASADLAAAVAARPGVWVLQHGYSHQDRAAPGSKRQELVEQRLTAELRAELLQGQRRLLELFGDRALAVLVPPWNRIDQSVAALLPELGFRAVSTFRGAYANLAVPGLCQSNCHLDPMDWEHRGFLGAEKSLRQLLGALQVGTNEPLGLMTHHGVHDAELWQFLEQLLDSLARHPGVCWLDAPTVFGLRLPITAAGPDSSSAIPG